MKKNPPIAMKRSVGWTNRGWAENQPVIERAARKAETGLRFLGLTYEAPKLGRVRRYPQEKSPDDIVGLAFDKTNFALIVETRDGGRLHAARNAADWSGVIVHEVVHCARHERPVDDSYTELAATEGLAYNAQRQYLERFCGNQAVNLLADYDLALVDPRLSEAFETIRTARKERQGHHKWFNARTANPYVNDGSLLGAQCVYRQLQRGHTLADLINQPAEDVLGLS